MEAFALYIIKSVIWLTGFALVYILFLRNERFFELNRIFLLSGILAALIFPIITVSYKVILPVVSDSQSENAVVSAVQNIPVRNTSPDFRLMLVYLYLTGFLFVAFMIIKQSRSLYKVIRKSGITSSDPVKLIKTAEYDSAFSFFSYVFVNPSVTEIEIKEIMNHEIVHIRQKHWLDLIFVELLCILQWFNPVVWIYTRLVRQNHEYIADKVALQRTSDPAIYRAALLNQIVGSGTISLVNSFNYSLNKKRFNMMKNIISSPYRKMKILFILPVLAIVFYAFAKPDYQYISGSDNPSGQNTVSQASDKKVKGSIVQQNGTPLQGATVIVIGTTIGSTSDSKGYFSIDNVSSDATLVVSYVGFKSKVVKPVFTSDMTIKMIQDTIKYLNEAIVTPPPPPPPPPPAAAKSTGTEKIETPKPFSNVAPTPGVQNREEDLFVVVEELPEFPGGGRDAMVSWIRQNLKYPGEAYSKKIEGVVSVDFLVTSTGKINNVQVSKPVNALLDSEAKRIINSMPDWKPGSQNGKTVDVQMMVPVEFKLQW
jgi:TonB family protein